MINLASLSLSNRHASTTINERRRQVNSHEPIIIPSGNVWSPQFSFDQTDTGGY